MRNRWIAVGVSALVLGTAWWLVGRAAAKSAEPAALQTVRQGVELTVYAQDFGMVHESRPMQLSQGANRLRMPDVSRELDPESVLLKWQGANANLPQLVANSYDLGVSDGNSLLKRYLGQEVEVVRYGESGHEAERQKGTLMVEGNGETVVQSDGQFYIRPEGTIVAPANADIVTIPQLSVQADSPAAQAANLDVTYLTRGLSWSADYVATLSPQNSTLALDCWATVTNRTGVDYPNAKVSLIAGTPNRAVLPASSRMQQMQAVTESPSAGMRFADGQAKMKMPNIAGGAPETVGEFHAYNIQNPTTVVQEQMNRLLILSSASVPVIKDYSARPPELDTWDYYNSWGAQPKRGDVAVAVTFFNKEKDGLGAPLPQGAIRIYEPDKAGTLRYAGAATIQDTPTDQKVNLTLSRSFDVFTEWRLVKTQKVDKHTLQKQVELILHNEKATPVDLRIVQSFGGRWKIARESHPHTKVDANQAQWKVNVPADSKVTLTYSVNLAW
jgi:hypothetical protein